LTDLPDYALVNRESWTKANAESIWCDPFKWIPEAARLLRSGGELVFLRASPLAILCSPDAHVPADWARRWPAEEIWRARKNG
jgi:hypothetical protein